MGDLMICMKHCKSLQGAQNIGDWKKARGWDIDNLTCSVKWQVNKHTQDSNYYIKYVSIK